MFTLMYNGWQLFENTFKIQSCLVLLVPGSLAKSVARGTIEGQFFSGLVGTHLVVSTGLCVCLPDS